MIFTTSLDLFCKIVTAVVTVLFAVIIYAQILQISEVGYAAPVSFSAFLILMYGLVFLYRPIKYVVDEDNITIKRVIASKRILLSNIASITAVKKKQLRWAIRLFGVGGLFGYWGSFSNGEFGRMTWYATNLNKAVMIESKNGKQIMITPNDVDGFINQVQNKLVGSI
ncbi:MAG: hypothetical protein RIR12_2480 [Bacteroidota bacterium]|jgi:hypothetical protein